MKQVAIRIAKIAELRRILADCGIVHRTHGPQIDVIRYGKTVHHPRLDKVAHRRATEALGRINDETDTFRIIWLLMAVRDGGNVYQAAGMI